MLTVFPNVPQTPGLNRVTNTENKADEVRFMILIFNQTLVAGRVPPSTLNLSDHLLRLISKLNEKAGLSQSLSDSCRWFGIARTSNRV